MKLNSRTLVLACLAVFGLFAVSTPAQNPSLRNWAPKPHAPKASDAATREQQHSTNVKSEADSCAYTFTNAGANNSYMEFCVSTNGNIISFQSPIGIEYLDLGALSEGYGVCDEDTGAFYYDYSDYGASGFGPANLVTHNATTVKIARTTNDGLWTLTQTITKLAGATPYAKVSMALKNNSAANKVAILLRWADVDPFNAGSTADFQESFDSTINAAWGYTALDYSASADVAGYGLKIENIGNPTGVTPADNFFFEGIDWFVNTSPGATVDSSASPCDPFEYYDGYEALTDGSVEMVYFLGINAKHTATVNSRYVAF